MVEYYPTLGTVCEDSSAGRGRRIYDLSLHWSRPLVTPGLFDGSGANWTTANPRFRLITMFLSNMFSQLSCFRREY